jgi:hypothetical protein
VQTALKTDNSEEIERGQRMGQSILELFADTFCAA